MTTLDPRGLEAAAKASHPQFRYWLTKHDAEVASKEVAEAAITAYLAVTQPIVETVEELEGLPVGTVVEEDGGEVRIKSEKSWFCGCCLEDDFPNEDVILPARVIWRPHESA